MKVSYCTTCHGRLWQVALLLHENLDHLRDDEEIILLDYGSPDGLGRFVESSKRCMKAIDEGKLLFAQTNAKSYHCPKAKNLAHRLGRGELLVNLDADNSNAGMRSVIDRYYSDPSEKIVLHMDDGLHNGAYGRIGLPRKYFHTIGGYNEELLPSAYQDTDIIERAKAAGLRYVMFPSNAPLPIKNTAHEKAVHTGNSNWASMKAANKATSEANLKAGKILANPLGWGDATVRINFGEEKPLIPLSPMISIVMLNWNRPGNVHQLVERYGKMSIVGEILVVNNNPAVSLESLDKRATVITATKDLGLFSRFAAASLASFPAVMLVDDDLFLPEETIRSLHEAWSQNPAILHGIVGRNTTVDGYSRHPIQGHCEIVLTRAVITTPSDCARSLSYASRFNAALHGDPKGNGEDILHSFVVARASYELNMVHSLPFEEWPSEGSIHQRVSNHYEHRSRVVQWCREQVR